jgi:hypothetical protein
MRDEMAGRPGVAEAGQAAAPETGRTGPGGLVWLLTRWALAQVTADPLVGGRLAHGRVCQLLGRGQRPLAMAAAPVLTFGAVAVLEETIAAGELPPGTRAVLYDPEAWQFTPEPEQRDPARAMARAAALAHGHGLAIIVAPALSLTTVRRRRGNVPRWRRYLDLGLAQAAAQAADVVELQAQSLERDAATYQAFVRAAAAQARAANPGVSVLAGLSTNPPGAPVATGQLRAAVRATRATVDGYWLNIPRPGPHCPTCNPPQPGIGIELLRDLL